MDPLRIGRSIRALRIRHGWRQSDLAGASGVSRSVISRIELGKIASTNLRSAQAVCAALDADLEVRIRWRGEGLDRLLDEVHAGLVDRFVRMLRDAGWEVAVEVSFNEYGERGSIDALGWHAASRALLIAEIKSAVADAQGTLIPLDRKTRLGPMIARRRGWDSASVSRVLVVRDGSTNRRRLAALASTFDVAFAVRGSEFRRWIRAPSGSISALLFLPDSPQKSTGQGHASWRRVNRPRTQGPRSQ